MFFHQVTGLATQIQEYATVLTQHSAPDTFAMEKRIEIAGQGAGI